MERQALIAELERHAETLELQTTLDILLELEAELRDVRAFLAYLATQPLEAELPAPVAKVAQKPASAPRCPHYKAIRRVYAICKEIGLNTKADAAMRRAFENFLIRPVPSREVLDGRDWDAIGTAIKAGELCW
jgi:hypothetical protein